MTKHRIYGESIDIDAKSVETFFNDRAQNINEMKNPYSAVLLSDHAPELIEEQMRIEKEHIFPKLHIDEKSRVLDIGCGIGRWAQEIIPLCQYYHGIDFSQNMIDTAKERTMHFDNSNFKFERKSFQELITDCEVGLFNRVIISGILMYILDDDLLKCLHGLIKLLDKSCIIYIWEPCGIEQRLTLKDFPSEALGKDYNVIYRTKAEYDKFFDTFVNMGGGGISFSEYYSKLGGKVSYSDTDKIYYIIER